MAVSPFATHPTEIDGLVRIELKQIDDERGVVREFFRASTYPPALPPWRQVNVTETTQGAVRGMHGEDATKLVGIVEGEAFGAYVDLRADSPTRDRLVTLQLRKGTQVLVPPGVANGFQAVAPGVTQYLYCFDTEWAPDMTGVFVHPLDPTLAIPWPLAIDPENRAQLSAKDAALPLLDPTLPGV